MTTGVDTPTWRRRLAAVLGVLALTAVIAGATLLASAPAASRGSAPGPAEAVPVGGARPGPSDPDSEEARPPGPQPENSVRFPGGGTSALVRAELTADGTLPIPGGVDRASWWGAEFGAETGTALLAGHVDWYGSIGPFDELWRQRPGDVVSVRGPDGHRWDYRVVDVATVHKRDLATRAPTLFSQDGRHRLVLVTCGGDYLGGTDGYSDNRIVTAEPVAAGTRR